MPSPIDRAIFDRFLSSLHADREEAGQIYELLRRKLKMFFANRDCGAETDTLVDVTLDRLMAKPKDQTSGASSIGAYACGIARNVHREHCRCPRMVPVVEELAAKASSGDPQDSRLHCFKQCLKGLTEHERRLMSDYYEYEGQKKIRDRRQTAQGIGKSSNAFRVQLCRIRRKLHNCIMECWMREAVSK